MFDSHAHYTDRQFDADRDELLNRMFGSGGVEGVMLASSDIADSKASLALSKHYANMYCSAGVHPLECEKVQEDYLEQINALAKDGKVRAVGEIGLDYHYDIPRAAQIKVFYEQLDLANELGLPVIVHDREAHADCIEALISHKSRGVVHSYSGSRESAKILLSGDWYFSFSGVLTFKNAVSVREVAAYIPDGRILIETDCPYMAPVPYRGKRNDSLLMRSTLAMLAEVRGISFEEAERMTTENAKRLFSITQ